MNLSQISKKYNTHEKCVKYLEEVRWNNEPICVKCGSKKITPVKNDIGNYHCYNCHTTFSVITDTVLGESRLSLDKWFIIANLMVNARRGISSSLISRLVGIPYKTAWFCTMRLRCAMIEKDIILQPGGTGDVFDLVFSYDMHNVYIQNKTTLSSSLSFCNFNIIVTTP
jgi:transposase-like protein